MRGACAGACPSSDQRDRRNPGVRRCLARADARGRSPPCAPTLARAVAHLPPAGPIARPPPMRMRRVAEISRGKSLRRHLSSGAQRCAPRQVGIFRSARPAPRRRRPTPEHHASANADTLHMCTGSRGDSPCCGPAGAVNRGRAMTRSVFFYVWLWVTSSAPRRTSVSPKMAHARQ